MKDKIITLEQAPVVAYSLVEQRGKEVAALIESLNLDEIEATEDNLRLLKTTRADLGKEFKTFEEQRKMVKDLIMKPYNDFDEAYKKHISGIFKDTDIRLKNKIDTVDDAILQKKIDGIVQYFVEVNDYDFVAFADMDIKIIKSRSDKQIKEEIDEYLATVKSNLDMIETLDNKERILAKYMMHKDFSRAVTETQMEVKREAEMKARREENERQQAEAKERKYEVERQAAEAQAKEEATYVAEVMPDPIKEEHKIYKSSFTVYGTKDQFTELKQFMEEKGIRYERG